MGSEITYTNKDVLFKVLSQQYRNKSLAVYGLDVPKIKQMLPSVYPVISTEHRADTVFLLEDGSLLILEYESTVALSNFLKYLKYIYASIEYLRSEKYTIFNVIVAVVYTGDIEEAPSIYDIGALRIHVQQVFLSGFDSEEIYNHIKTKITSGAPLSDDDIMKLIVLPLTQPDKSHKQHLIESTVDLAKQVSNEATQVFILAGILTATNKFIDRNYANQIKEWIKMTQVARLYEEEKIEAVNKARLETNLKERKNIARLMLQDGEDYLKIMKYTQLTHKELEQMRQSLDA